MRVARDSQGDREGLLSRWSGIMSALSFVVLGVLGGRGADELWCVGWRRCPRVHVGRASVGGGVCSNVSVRDP